MAHDDKEAPEVEQLKAHHIHGHDLFSLKPRSKEPQGPWREPKAGFDAERHVQNGGNLGVRLTATDLVVDIDPRNFPEGRDILAELRERLGTDLLDADEFPFVRTGSGGFHVYLRKPADLRVAANLNRHGLPGIDLKTEGGYVVAAGSVHPDGGIYRWAEDELWMPSVKDAPAALLELAVRNELPASIKTDCPLTVEELIDRLNGLDPLEYGKGRYEQWIELLISFHAAAGGDTDAMLAFQAWSERDPEYANGGAGPSIEDRWQGLEADRKGGITWQTFARHVAGVAPSAEIAASDFEDDLPAIADEAKPKKPKKPNVEVDHPVLHDWVFVGDASSFIRRTDFKQYKQEQWNAMFADLCPDRNLPSLVYKNKTPVRKFEELVYIPGRPPTFDNAFNLWRPSAAEPRPSDTSIIERHLELLLPDETERDYFLDYMHFLVCRPEVKMMFAALVVGSQGTGKSAIGLLLKRTIGKRNVSQPSNGEVTGNWTAWQQGASLAIIEELMTLGKLEVANKLKPVITDDTLRIENKNMPLYSIPNHLNILAFTNHDDAVRLEDGDRRWMVLSSPMEPQDDAYYDDLFGWIGSEEAPGAFIHMLQQRTPKLNPKGRAPMTAGKLTMREASKSDIELTIEQWLEEQSGPFAHALFRVDDACDELRRSAATKVSQAKVRTALKRFGCVKHPRNTNAGGGLPTCQLWSCRDHTKWEAEGPAGRAKAWRKIEEANDAFDG
ncbi:bifunctional DNA primase/polymerase [Parvularcula maris]|uniref:Bifunctional DNA primase/polymerase n=1 Tax=Parvularcula maris TaxID=2965077 RepID=A0A9X2LBC7_9PROT|nr:bifunctional DNA primase/polymerase [Parvularcula maris]MCQ8186431.1 bifunctional DNA primase/polymerase [Parvularcula maris]